MVNVDADAGDDAIVNELSEDAGDGRGLVLGEAGDDGHLGAPGALALADELREEEESLAVVRRSRPPSRGQVEGAGEGEGEGAGKPVSRSDS